MESTNQIVVAESKALTTPGNGNDARGLAAMVAPEMRVMGIENLEREDLIIPRLVLIQPTTRDIPGSDEHMGQWYNIVSGGFKKTITAVLLAVAKKRIAFSRNFSADGKALCASDDSEYPRKEFVGAAVFDERMGTAQTIDGGPCALCPLSQFHTDGETRIAPMCSKTFVYSLLDIMDSMPVLMTVKRTGMQAGRQLNFVAVTAGRSKSILVSSKKIEDTNGKYFVPVFATGEQTTDSAIELATALNDLGNLAASQARVDDDDPLATAAERLGGIEVGEQEIPNW